MMSANNPKYHKYKRTYDLYYRYDPDNNKWLYVTMPISIDFTIERNNLATANRCRITLYNLSKKTRDLFFRDELDIGKPYNPEETLYFIPVDSYPISISIQFLSLSTDCLYFSWDSLFV